jgi:hypothetical protein
VFPLFRGERDGLAVGHYSAPSISFRMSSTRQADVRGPSFTGFGKRPTRTPSNHVLLPTGKTARILGSRTNPTLGNWVWASKVFFIATRMALETRFAEMFSAVFQSTTVATTSEYDGNSLIVRRYSGS